MREVEDMKDEVYQALLDHQLQPVMNDYVYL